MSQQNLHQGLGGIQQGLGWFSTRGFFVFLTCLVVWFGTSTVGTAQSSQNDLLGEVELSLGGGSVFADSPFGFLDTQVLLPIWTSTRWNFRAGLNTRLLLPAGYTLGVSGGAVGFLSYRTQTGQPFIQCSTSLAYIESARWTAECVVGSTIGIPEFQGLRVFAGINRTLTLGAVIGGLIFLAW